jgi:hypothetical protein
MKLRLLAWLPFVVLLSLSPVAWGWSAKGHGEIAVAALERLPKPLQDEYRTVLMAGPWAKGDISWRTAAMRAAAWPDRVKDMPLRKLFGQYGSGKVPAALQSYRKPSTADWHYTNALFIDTKGRLVEATANAAGKSCPPARQGELLTIWPTLFTAYKQATDPRDKAIVLAFVLHFVGDAYQPLHLLGSLDDSCRQDKGGNAFCVGPVVGFKAGLRCRDNLHYLWDQGFGAYKEDLTVGKFRGDARSLDAAVKEVRRIATEVYPKKPADIQSAAYKNRSSRHARQMAQLASAHLAAALQNLGRK